MAADQLAADLKAAEQSPSVPEQAGQQKSATPQSG
jgi:hypothetical protein